MSNITSIETRFWKKVDRNDPSGCWLWTACLQGQNGYGYFRISKELGNISAHRYSYQLVHGDIPKGMIICHSCDNPKCVNPNHLFLGTHQDNAKDRESKKRCMSHGQQKLTEKQAQEIKSSDLSQSKLSKLYEVSRATIAQIQNGETWAHIPLSNSHSFTCEICNNLAFRTKRYFYQKVAEGICMKCHRSLNGFNNNPGNLERAISYLKKKID